MTSVKNSISNLAAKYLPSIVASNKHKIIQDLNPFLEIYKNGIETIKIDSRSDTEDFVKIFHGLFKQSEHLEVTFITHGFISNIERDRIPEMKTAILNCAPNFSRGARVVVLVDWSTASGWTGVYWRDCLKYSSALGNLKHIGTWLAQFITALKMEFGAKVYTHGIGHSLGAHLMGISGKVGNLGQSSKIFDRITGLDPAGHRVPQGNYCLCKEDAVWVDVIHTSPWLGRSDSNGTVDFFPNFGQTQPGCSSYSNESHIRVLDLFLWSISNPGKFVTRKQFEISDLKNWGDPPLTNAVESAEMGFHCQPGTAGIYYVETTDQEPWFYENK